MPGSSPREGGASVASGAEAEAGPASPTPSSPMDWPQGSQGPQLQRRLSTSSDASSSGLNDSQKADANMDYIPTRMTKVSTPKPAANPLQFVKVGPCDLFKSAQETLKKVEEVKKMKKEVRDEAEDWQSNLDNWKCSRRKRVEHIIDRVVEVKKLELEEHERNRRKAKTFSEMMEERTSRGRKMSLLVHKDDDSNDLSDLGIGTSSDKSSVSEDFANDDNHSMDDEVSVKNHFHEQNGSNEQNGKAKMGNIGHDDDASTTTTISSPEPEEYTYDRAIQGYVNFTETRVKSRTSSHVSRTETETVEEVPAENTVANYSQKHIPAPAPKPRKDSKVEEDIAEIERIQSRKSGSISDLQSPEKKVTVPKIDILKRKELFERSESQDGNEHCKIAPRAAGDLVNAKSIRDRVSNLGRQKSEETERSKQVKQLSSDVSVKDRLSLLERQQSTESQVKSCSNAKLNSLVPAGDVAAPAPLSIKDRLSSLEQVSTQDRSSKVCTEIATNSIKNRLSELEAPKEVPKRAMPDRDPSFRDKLANFRSTEQDLNSHDMSKSGNSSVVDSSRFSSPDEEEYYRKRTFHRSLDSLDIDSSSVLSNEPYERVQSLEDLDSCGPSRHYPASASSNENLVLSSHSGDTDREDSGIHTADVSCSVSQADEPADIGDMNLPCSNSENGEGERNLDYAPPTIVSQLAKIKLSGTVPQDKFSSRPEVVSPEALCPDHSQVLVDLPNSHSSSKSVAVSSKTYSAQHSCLPTIPEVSHDSPPKVFVSDTEPITPAHCTEASIPPTTTSSPLENENIFGCIDETEIASQMSRAVVLVSDRIEEGKNICLQDETCMPNDNPDETCVSCEEVPSSQSVETVSPAEMSISTVNPSLHLVEEQEKDVADVSVAEVAEISDISDPKLNTDKGSKSYCINATSKDSQIIVDQATSIEADSDVSSFLDQALFEEDLKMEGSTLSGNEKGSDLHLPLSHSVTKNDVCPVIQQSEVSVMPLSFPLGTSTLAEPPKEKPPPPPVELSDDEDHTAQPKNQSTGSVHIECQKPNLGRLDSTKRIKKDIRRKRSDFLGIEGNNDDSYLDTELKVTPPPDMTSFLQEERRLEQELYRQMQPTLYPESDHGSNQGESRDSGVELDNHLHSHNLLTDFSNEDQSCENHSRQSSEPFGNASSTSEEDEIIKKEREIIEILEKEEQWRYGTNTILSPSDHHQVGEKLAAKLRELEQEKMRLEWERAEETRKAAAEQAARQDEQRRIRIKEEQLRQQESIVGRLPADVPFDCDPSDMTPEALREERERLKQEQAELDRQREILAANQMSSRQSWDSSSSSTAHRSLQDVSGSPHAGSHNQLNVPASNTPLNCRLSLPDLQQSDFAVHPMGVHHHRPPPPIPPSKPLSVVSQESHGVNGHARQPQLQSSSDSLTISSESHHHRHNAVGLPSVPMASSPTSSTGSQQMTRQTLHALSAAPRSKIIATDTWVQAKRKPESQRNSNRDHYQHWLIQEAEHRRITEQQQRNATSRKSLPPNFAQGHSQPKLTTQPAQQPPPQSWQYQHPHHQSNVHQMPHQHHHSHVHSHPQFSHGPVQATAPPVPPPPRQEKPLPDAIIQSLTQRVQNRVSINENNRRHENSPARDGRPSNQVATNIINNNNNNNLSNININHGHTNGSYAANTQEKMLSVSGKKKCSHCNEELGRGAAMIIESLRLFYHMDCFKCCVCHVQLGDGLMGTDVRVRNHKLHCHNCYSSDDGVKFSCV